MKHPPTVKRGNPPAFKTSTFADLDLKTFCCLILPEEMRADISSPQVGPHDRPKANQTQVSLPEPVSLLGSLTGA